jgi:predicted HAD superfamily Cof-like phosphohydrolase
MSTFEAYTAVKEFHEKYGHLIFQRHGVVPLPQRLLRARLILEELGELAIAMHENHEVEIADAVGDLLYVTVGTAVSCLDRPIADAWTDKLPAVKDLKALAVVTGSVSRVVTDLANDRDLFTLVHSLSNLVFALNCSFNLPLREIFKEIHKSNMTKSVVSVVGGKKGSVKGPDYVPPDLKGILCIST